MFNFQWLPCTSGCHLRLDDNVVAQVAAITGAITGALVQQAAIISSTGGYGQSAKRFGCGIVCLSSNEYM